MDVGVKSQSKQKKSKIQGFMDKIEMLGNKLPHPVLMFIDEIDKICKRGESIISISSIR